ncbi:hypothetical protein ACA910_021555 [Epithemia clementina (nom. ined.)]
MMALEKTNATLLIFLLIHLSQIRIQNQFCSAFPQPLSPFRATKNSKSDALPSFLSGYLRPQRVLTHTLKDFRSKSLLFASSSSPSSPASSWSPTNASDPSSENGGRQDENKEVRKPTAKATPTATTTNKRSVIKLQKYTRYPVWPAWNGALIWAVGKLLGNTIASELEDQITGRVCPNFFLDDSLTTTTTTMGDLHDEETPTTSPFLLLVHHCHSFAAWDPLRYFQRALILPEGFPAHPHRGFITLTYFLHGGFRHRDSMGVEQFYGVSSNRNQKRQEVEEEEKSSFPHSQWLSTGAGLLHEEMFDNNNKEWWQRHELYQIWINVPASLKMNSPSIHLLADHTDTPVVLEQNERVKVRVLAGNYRNKHKASTPINTEMLILHVFLEPGAKWSCPLPASGGWDTCFLYLRQGTLTCFSDGEENDSHTSTVEIPPHYTAHFSKTGHGLELQEASGKKRADFMFLAAVPIPEPCVTRGSMVMTTPGEIQQAYADYQLGYFGLPWDHKLSQPEWKDHVQMYPSRYSLKRE